MKMRSRDLPQSLSSVLNASLTTNSQVVPETRRRSAIHSGNAGLEVGSPQGSRSTFARPTVPLQDSKRKVVAVSLPSASGDILEKSRLVRRRFTLESLRPTAYGPTPQMRLFQNSIDGGTADLETPGNFARTNSLVEEITHDHTIDCRFASLMTSPLDFARSIPSR